jgi:hypothetical protein
MPPINSVALEVPVVEELECAMRIEYMPEGRGASVTCELDDTGVSCDVLLGASPIRKPAFYKGQWSKPGWYWMASVGHHVSYESKFERSLLQEVDFQGDATMVVPQPFRLHFERSESPHRHVPDFLIAYRATRPELVDVKGARARERALNRLTFTLTARACQDLGLDFTVFTEPDAHRQSNIAFLAGYRNPRHATLDQLAPKLVELLEEGPVSFHRLVACLASRVGVSEAVAAAAVWRGVWRRTLEAPLSVALSLESPIDVPCGEALGAGWGAA